MVTFCGGIFLVVGLAGGLMLLIYVIEYISEHYPHTRAGRFCRAINRFISSLPED